LLRWSLNRDDGARSIEDAVSRALASGLRTADIVAEGQPPVATGVMTDAVIEALRAS